MNCEIPSIIEKVEDLPVETLNQLGIRKVNTEISQDEILFNTIKRLGMKRESNIYIYDDAVEMLRKYLQGILDFKDLITPADLFDLFLIKFKTDVLGEKIKLGENLDE